MGSASLTNCMTSSMVQDEGFLLGPPSRSEASGPVVELAASTLLWGSVELWSVELEDRRLMGVVAP